MANRRNTITAFLSALGMVVLILDSKTAVSGATEGIEMCIRTVIPSLFPFFILSILLTSAAPGTNPPLLHALGNICGMPKGTAHIMLVGFLGGYPVGAQTIAQAYQNGYLTKHEAHRALGFCSNAGPSFFFGLAGCLFSSKFTAFSLWIIHILSAIIVAVIMPGKSKRKCDINRKAAVTLPEALWKSLRIICSVCGWIVLFRVLIAFLNRWFIWMLPAELASLTAGLLEAANGCIGLKQIQSEFARFIICSVILGFGGMCVGMQTIYVTGDLGTGMYFPGKILQAVFSGILSCITAYFVFIRKSNPMIVISLTCILLLNILIICKIAIAFLSKLVYNNKKQERNLCKCCFGEK